MRTLSSSPSFLLNQPFDYRPLDSYGGGYFLIPILNLMLIFITTYNLANLAYHLAIYPLQYVIKNHYLAMLVLLTALLVGTIYYSQNWFFQLLESYTSGQTSYLPPLFFENLANHTNLVVSLLVFLLINFLTYALILKLYRGKEVRINKFLNVNLGSIRLFHAYVLQIAKSQETIFTVVLCITGYGVGLFFAQPYLIFIFILPSFMTVYNLVQTEPIRHLLKKLSCYSVLKDYWMLVGASCLVNFGVSLPFLVYEWLGRGNPWYALATIRLILVANIYLLMVGILFPPQDDNPFSIVIGTVITGAIGFLFSTVFLWISPSLVFQLFTIIGSIIGMVIISIYYLKKYSYRRGY